MGFLSVRLLLRLWFILEAGAAGERFRSKPCEVGERGRSECEAKIGRTQGAAVELLRGESQSAVNQSSAKATSLDRRRMRGVEGEFTPPLAEGQWGWVAGSRSPLRIRGRLRNARPGASKGGKNERLKGP